MQFYAKTDDLHDGDKKCIFFLFFRCDIKYRGMQNYWHRVLSSRSNWNHGRGLGGIITICQSIWKRSRTISQGIDRGGTFHDDKYYEMIIIARSRGITCCISDRHSEILRYVPAAPGIGIDRLSAACTSIAGSDCNNRGNCVANSLCRVRETTMPNVTKCVFTRPCDVPALQRDYNLRGDHDLVIHRWLTARSREIISSLTERVVSRGQRGDSWIVNSRGDKFIRGNRF